MEWFRLYNEFRSDPKLLGFTKQQRYDIVCLLCLASESEERGSIFLDADDLSGALGLSSQEYLAFESRLHKKDIALRREDGALVFCHWERRQPVSDSAAARMRAYRKRHRSEQSSTQLRNGDVTVTLRTEQIDRTEQNHTREEVFAPHEFDSDSSEWQWKKETATMQARQAGYSQEEIDIGFRNLKGKKIENITPYFLKILKTNREQINGSRLPVLLPHKQPKAWTDPAEAVK